MRLAIAVVITGCIIPTFVPTEHEYALARHIDGRLTALPTDDPLYERFAADVLSDPTLQRLLMLFEHTTESFLATNRAMPAPRTVANRLVIVLDSDEPGVLHDVRLVTPNGQARIELALGLGERGQVDLAGARHRMAAALAPLLLELVGVTPPDGPTVGIADLATEPATPEEALWRGYALALEAEYARPALGQAPADEVAMSLNPPPASLVERQAAIAARAAYSLGGGVADSPSAWARDASAASPMAVAAFLVALQRGAGHYYPQQHMLWMVSYEPEEVPFGKVLLAFMRLPRGAPATVEALIATYGETYPAERAMVRDLADAILGPPIPRGTP